MPEESEYASVEKIDVANPDKRTIMVKQGWKMMIPSALKCILE